MKKYLLSLLTCTALFANPAQEICAQLISLKEAIIQQTGDTDLLFLTFWNFDNTILNGDTSEGSPDFKGLGQVSIEAGLSKKYPPNGGYAKFLNDYHKMEKKNEPAAYAYMIQMLAGAKESAVLTLATNYFNSTLKDYFFSGSSDLIRCLQENGIQVQVITASPELFVQGAAPLLNIPTESITGMETTVIDGLLTDKLVLPLITRQGKIEKIKQIVAKLEGEQNTKAYILAGFGNNNANDGPFLQWIESQSLPAGKPFVLKSDKLAPLNNP
jgi:phosphoserine phosphatase